MTEKSGGKPAALSCFTCRKPDSYSKRSSRSFCPLLTVGPRQYNQHEVDTKEPPTALVVG